MTTLTPHLAHVLRQLCEAKTTVDLKEPFASNLAALGYVEKHEAAFSHDAFAYRVTVTDAGREAHDAYRASGARYEYLPPEAEGE